MAAAARTTRTIINRRQGVPSLQQAVYWFPLFHFLPRLHSFIFFILTQSPYDLTEKTPLGGCNASFPRKPNHPPGGVRHRGVHFDKLSQTCLFFRSPPPESMPLLKTAEPPSEHGSRKRTDDVVVRSGNGESESFVDFSSMHLAAHIEGEVARARLSFHLQLPPIPLSSLRCLFHFSTHLFHSSLLPIS